MRTETRPARQRRAIYCRLWDRPSCDDLSMGFRDSRFFHEAADIMQKRRVRIRLAAVEKKRTTLLVLAILWPIGLLGILGVPLFYEYTDGTGPYESAGKGAYIYVLMGVLPPILMLRARRRARKEAEDLRALLGR